VASLTGQLDDVRVDVDRSHLSVRSGQVREQRGVITSAGTDLKNPVPGPNVELPKLERHYRWLRQAAQNLIVTTPLRDHCVVVVRLLQGGVGNEQVALDGTQRLLDRGAERVSSILDLRDHRMPQELGRRIGDCRVHRNLSLA
jgi:hypothetical protein